MGGYGYSCNDLGLKADVPVVVYGVAGSGSVVCDVLREAGVPVVAVSDEAEEQGVVRPADVVLDGVQLVVKSPGISFKKPLLNDALDKKIKILGEVDLWWRARRHDGARVIGVTGTNGKSTVASLVGHVLGEAGYEVAVGGNIGLPALAMPRVAADGFYVLELSSYQCEMLEALALDAAALTNLTPDHLDRHGTMEAYLAAKLRMFGGLKVGGVAVVGEHRLADAVEAAAGRAPEVADGTADGMRDAPRLPGPHNRQNMAVARALVAPWVDEEVFWRAVETYPGLPHRMEVVADVVLGGSRVRFVNDSKATNGDSAVWALRSFDNILWICGGRAKSDGLGAALGALDHVKAALVIGECAADFAAVLRDKNVPVVEECGDMATAVARAAEMARGMEASVVLLSPATASWDQYRNFEARGDDFRRLVAALAGTE